MVCKESVYEFETRIDLVVVKLKWVWDTACELLRSKMYRPLFCALIKASGSDFILEEVYYNL